MAGKDEILRIEQEISDINAVLHKAVARLPHAKKLCADIEGCLAAERAALNLAKANIKHMREVADHVVLKEWLEVSTVAMAKAEAVYRKQLELAKVMGEIAGIEELVPDLEVQKKLRVAKLAEYGQVHTLQNK